MGELLRHRDAGSARELLEGAAGTLLHTAGGEMSRAAGKQMQHPHGDNGGSEKSKRGEKEG
jgi:hypothetical protein